MNINTSNFANITEHIDDNLLINPVISFRWYPYAINYKYFQIDNYFSELDTEEKREKVRKNLGITENTKNLEAKINTLTNSDENIRLTSSLFGSFIAKSGNNTVDIEYKNLNGDFTSTINIPQATLQKAGVMSADDKIDLANSTVKKITWNSSSNINNLVTSGVYHISGERLNINDNLPIANSNPGHTIDARLTILDSSIPGNGKDDDKCITQVMSFNNRLGQGEVYIRIGKGSSLTNLTWEKWSTLQRNVNVGEVKNLDDLIDNGIYSGVYVKNAAEVETFVMVVINNYAAAETASVPKSISQFKYSINVGGSIPKYETRVGAGNPVSFTPWGIINEDNIASMINTAIKDITEGVDPEKIDSLKDIVAWIEAHGGDVQAIYNSINQNTVKINAEVNRAQEAEEQIWKKIGAISEQYFNADKEIKAQALGYDKQTVLSKEDKVTIKNITLDGKKEMSYNIPSATNETAGVMSAEDKKIVDGLENGSTIVAQAREIHSRNGKNDSASFLVRTTAGSGTIGDGVATLKSVGGNIVKNLVGDVNDNGWKVALNSCAISTHNGIMTINPTTETFQQVAWGITLDKDFRIAGHKYYYRCNIKSANADNNIFFGVMNYRGLDKRHVVDAASTSEWQALSVIVNANPASVYLGCSICDKRAVLTTLYVKNFYVIDLTEMFGEAKANQMTKEECNRLFGTMDALPQGLSIANPSVFKSTGFNQFNPDMVLVNKAIVDGAIVDGDKTLAIIPCLPCKIGVGENNGYCIHGDFGEDIKVYLTPLNPLEVEGELYLCELTKDTDKGTYVPQIKGYMLVEVPNATDLCVHFLWSEDRGRHDFEPYYESKVELPTIPEMSEYGLAGIQSSGTLVCDEIDFEKGVYRKKIGAVDMGSLTWSVNTLGDRFVSSAVPGLSDKGYSKINNIICELYTTRRSTDTESTFREDANKRIFVESYWGSVIIVVDSAYTDAAALKESLQGVMLYYELAEPIEYPLPKVANNYTSSDYGVEQFDGAVPCNTNNLYYMRSLAGETRNFLDRMYANTGKRESPIAVADYITTNIAENKAKAEEAPNLALRALFIAAGAEYNEETGYYTVGDLNDVTESQMLAIFNYKDAVTNLFLDRYPGNANIRCIIPSANIYAYGQMYPTGRPLAGIGMFTNSDIEVFKLYKNQDINSVNTINIPYISNNLYGAFNHCKKLKVIYPINVSLVTNSSRLKDLVVGCTELAEVRLLNIKASCSLSDSPLVSKDSIMYMIQNAAPTSAITITLHADAYARLKDDADIVAALAAQPLVTLVSA